MSDPRIFEDNLRALLRRAYIPVRPTQGFRRELEAEFLDAWQAALERRRAPAGGPRPAQRSGARIAAAFLAAAAALLLWISVDRETPSSAPRGTLTELLARGQIAARTAPNAPFEARNDPLSHRAGFLELATPEFRGARVDGPAGALEATADSHLVLADPFHVGLEQGGLAFEHASRDDWRLDAAPGSVLVRGASAEHPAGSRLEASLEGTQLLVRLERGEAFALTPRGAEALPLGESRLRAGDLVPLLATAPGSDPSRSEPEPTLEVATPDGGDEVEVARDDPAGATLVGVVRDPDGRPVDSFEVRLLVEQDYANVTDPERRSFASDDGRFAWSGIEPGSYDVFVSAPGFAHWKHDGRVELSAAEALEIDVELEQGATARGLVVDRATGLGVPDAIVLSEADVPLMALPLDDPEGLAELGHLTRTRGDGSFELNRLSSGSQLLRVSAAGYAPAWSERFEIGVRAEIDGLTFELGPEARVGGYVFGEDGRPEAGVALVAAIVDNSGKRFCMSFAEARTDLDGHYELAGLPQEFAVVVNLGKDFSQPPEIQPVQLRAGDEQRVDFGVEAVGTRVFGTVYLPDGRGATSMPISIAPEGMANSFDGWRAGSTDAAGRFEFLNIEPGRYDFFASYGMVGSVTRVGTIDVPEWSEVEQDLHIPDGRFVGRITRAEDGAPAAFAVVVLETMDPTSTAPREEPGNAETFVSKAMTQQDGSFAVEHLAPGTYRAIVYSSGDPLSPSLHEFELESGAVRHDFALEPGSRPLLRVSNRAGEPVPSAKVKVYDVETGFEILWEQNPFTDADGVLRLSPSAASLVRIQITAEGYRPYAAEHRLELGEPELLVTLLTQ